MTIIFSNSKNIFYATFYFFFSFFQIDAILRFPFFKKRSDTLFCKNIWTIFRIKKVSRKYDLSFLFFLGASTKKWKIEKKVREHGNTNCSLCCFLQFMFLVIFIFLLVLSLIQYCNYICFFLNKCFLFIFMYFFYSINSSLFFSFIFK